MMLRILATFVSVLTVLELVILPVSRCNPIFESTSTTNVTDQKGHIESPDATETAIENTTSDSLGLGNVNTEFTSFVAALEDLYTPSSTFPTILNSSEPSVNTSVFAETDLSDFNNLTSNTSFDTDSSKWDIKQPDAFPKTKPSDTVVTTKLLDGFNNTQTSKDMEETNPFGASIVVSGDKMGLSGATGNFAQRPPLRKKRQSNRRLPIKTNQNEDIGNIPKQNNWDTRTQNTGSKQTQRQRNANRQNSFSQNSNAEKTTGNWKNTAGWSSNQNVQDFGNDPNSWSDQGQNLGQRNSFSNQKNTRMDSSNQQIPVTPSDNPNQWAGKTNQNVLPQDFGNQQFSNQGNSRSQDFINQQNQNVGPSNKATERVSNRKSTRTGFSNQQVDPSANPNQWGDQRNQNIPSQDFGNQQFSNQGNSRSQDLINQPNQNLDRRNRFSNRKTAQTGSSNRNRLISVTPSDNPNQWSDQPNQNIPSQDFGNQQFSNQGKSRSQDFINQQNRNLGRRNKATESFNNRISTRTGFSNQQVPDPSANPNQWGDSTNQNILQQDFGNQQFPNQGNSQSQDLINQPNQNLDRRNRFSNRKTAQTGSRTRNQLIPVTPSDNPNQWANQPNQNIQSQDFGNKQFPYQGNSRSRDFINQQNQNLGRRNKATERFNNRKSTGTGFSNQQVPNPSDNPNQWGAPTTQNIPPQGFNNQQFASQGNSQSQQNIGGPNKATSSSGKRRTRQKRVTKHQVHDPNNSNHLADQSKTDISPQVLESQQTQNIGHGRQEVTTNQHQNVNKRNKAPLNSNNQQITKLDSSNQQDRSNIATPSADKRSQSNLSHVSGNSDNQQITGINSSNQRDISDFPNQSPDQSNRNILPPVSGNQQTQNKGHSQSQGFVNQNVNQRSKDPLNSDNQKIIKQDSSNQPNHSKIIKQSSDQSNQNTFGLGNQQTPNLGNAHSHQIVEQHNKAPLISDNRMITRVDSSNQRDSGNIHIQKGDQSNQNILPKGSGTQGTPSQGDAQPQDGNQQTKNQGNVQLHDSVTKKDQHVDQPLISGTEKNTRGSSIEQDIKSSNNPANLQSRNQTTAQTNKFNNQSNNQNLQTSEQSIKSKLALESTDSQTLNSGQRNTAMTTKCPNLPARYENNRLIIATDDCEMVADVYDKAENRNDETKNFRPRAIFKTLGTGIATSVAATTQRKAFSCHQLTAVTRTNTVTIELIPGECEIELEIERIKSKVVQTGNVGKESLQMVPAVTFRPKPV